MTTLTPEQSANLLRQLQEAQRQLDAVKAQQGFQSAPTGQLSAAQMGGASGVGFEDTNTQTGISGQLQTGSEQGMSSAETRNVSAGQSPAPQVMSAAQAEFALRGAGLSGIINPSQFAGLSPQEAQRRIQEERKKRLGQTSALTSFAFNPEALASTKRIIDRISFTLTDVKNDPFGSNGTKNDQIKSILEGGSREIAALFNTPEEFQQAMMTNPQLQQTMQTFQALGGNQADIQNKIQPPQNIQPQTAGDYLSAIQNPYANQQAQQMAMEEMFPEREIAQQEIMRQARIPQEMAELYFGTENQIGIVQMKKLQAQEQARIIDQQAKDEKIAVERRARMAIDRNNAEMQIQLAKVEENRLAAKNYMTGMLAKLGALQTTGAAPQALQTLETKYQNAAQQLEVQFKFANREIELGLDEEINKLATGRDNAILKLEQNLTKDYEDIVKEIMKLEQSAEKEIYRVTEQYARRLRERTTKYTSDLQKEAEKYAKSFGRIAGGGIDLFSLSNTLEGTLGRASSKTAITSTAAQVKTDIKNNMPATVANRIINELNDEQLRLFLEDFLNERVQRQQSFEVIPFFERWKQETGVRQRAGSTVSNLNSSTTGGLDPSKLSPSARAFLGVE
jgi:hypothetical protein